MKKMHLCDYCIDEIKSHGDKLFVDDETIEAICDWCDEVTNVVEAAFIE